MRSIGRAGLTILGVTLSALPVGAQQQSQESQKGALPAVAACPAPLAEIATCYSEKLSSGAYLLAAMPKDWNGNLIVFGHGGPAVVPPTATTSQGDLAKYAFAVKLGYAWIASSYRREGYGVQMAVEDSDQARRFFIDRIAKPKRTIYHGASYGGLVGAKLIEAHAKNPDGSVAYDGALFNSGYVVGSAGRPPVPRRSACRLSILLQEPAACGRAAISPVERSAGRLQADAQAARRARRRVHRSRAPGSGAH